MKNRQKIAGRFRKNSGHEMYCIILSVIETMKRRKMGLIENIKKIFLGYTGCILAGVKVVIQQKAE